MPRLLQKNIFRASVITVLLGSLAALVFVGSLLHHGKIAGAFNIINLIFLVSEQSNARTSMLRFDMPDYMYIAPYSREQREKLIRKGMIYKLFAIYIILLLIVIAPIMIYVTITGNEMGIVICIAEAVIIFTNLYSRMHLRYLIKVSVSLYVAVQIVTFFQYVIFAAVTGYSNHAEESYNIIEAIKYHLTDVFLLSCLIFMGVIVVAISRIKHFNHMICYLADYENSR